MDIKDCFNLGYIAKLHGFKGEVSLFLDVTDPSTYSELKIIYLEVLPEQLVPFSIVKIKSMNKGFAVVQLNGIDSEEKAKEILRKNVCLPLELLPELGEKEFYDHEIVGFQVIDKTQGNIGVAQQVIDLTANPLLQIDWNGKEVLVPLFKGLVQRVDRKSKQLTIDVPPGLLDLYK
ncbi:MAG: ribosome maturation factor RimM [Bacteroidota bacterium]